MEMGEDENRRHDPVSDFERDTIAFSDEMRAAISLRLAGYSEEQVEKLMSRGWDFERRRAA